MKSDALWRIFSLFIRLRDTKDGYGKCCTCGKLIHYKDGHAGHFISRRHLNTKYDEKNVALQCVGCNTYQQGRQYEFSIYVDKRWGKGTAEELLVKSRQLKKMTEFEVKELIKEYKQKVNDLLGNSNSQKGRTNQKSNPKTPKGAK